MDSRQTQQSNTGAADDLNAQIVRTLRAGVRISFTLLLAGLFWTVVAAIIAGEMPPVKPRAGDKPPGNVTLLYAGLLVLMATPILRILVALRSFYHMGDRRFTRITAIVLIVVVASILLSVILLPGKDP
ncbi:MAG TPA: DUF1634 domain-containing protein [Chthonomonadales bacterium]|nr:DUF1634 domain-containing protein [Chthonomonadales bacterium]